MSTQANTEKDAIGAVQSAKRALAAGDLVATGEQLDIAADLLSAVVSFGPKELNVAAGLEFGPRDRI